MPSTTEHGWINCKQPAAQAIAVKGEQWSEDKHSRTGGGIFHKQVHDPLKALLLRARSAIKPYDKTWSVLDSGTQVGYVHLKMGGGYVGQRGDTIIGNYADRDAAARAVVKKR